MTNPHFDSVQAAQTRRLLDRNTRDDQILSILDAMPPERAYRLARIALSRSVSRGMKEAHARPVDGG